ncbi:DEAD/DEAH box helicase [Amedibacillus hominis]|uniref:DNA 3'-5' helicase n=1 Tax=Amedibacillus hominis TaxID=2897776 RepID=A0ABS9R4H7_9FIRM|nr:DEAD/DEAH box helicase [Amedibacillus hominis]MCH4284561.1 DEAD/DEAH box helicase [Amedibacillus hominis]
MKDKEIHEFVENTIKSNHLTSFVDSSCFNNPREEYVYNSAKRLLKTWFNLQEPPLYKVDFECSLRNYLSIVKTTINIPNYEPSSKFEELGLHYDSDLGKIWANLTIPSFFNSTFVKQLYMQNYVEEEQDLIHSLHTNGFIRKITGFEYFKSNKQKLAVMGSLRVPNGYSCLVSMTTGGGKSLITQTIAYQNVGLTIVIVPTISLMLDQYNNAREIIKSEVDNEIFYYYSNVSLEKFCTALKNKTARLLFVSPESLIKNKVLREKIEEANCNHYLKNIVIDEAHIIIEWGSSFRIDFQCLDALRKNFINVNSELRTFLLSATYSDTTIRQLKMFYSTMDKWIEIRCERLRHETRFDVIKCDNYGEKLNKIYSAIDYLPRPMIVYVKSPDDAVNLKKNLENRGYNNAKTFTGITKNEERLQIIEEWKNGDFDLMIATCAFGVGVDKKDVRTVLHTYIPENPNKYYQEAGRGGRDGLPCLSTIIYTNQDVDSAFNFVSKVITTEKLIGRWFSMLLSNKTQPLHNSQYLIDTYVKPKYNSNEEFIDSISSQDINWNVYVILFLRRNGFITIDDIQYVNQKYVFYITILERKLLAKNDETFSVIDNARNNEWKNTEREFTLMRNNLKKVGKCCWSDMFTKIYRKTDEYCAGCNEHMDVINFEDSKTLKADITGPLSSISLDINSYMLGTKCMLLVSKAYEYEILNIIDLGINTFVSDEYMLERIIESTKKLENNFSTLFTCNYREFLELISLNRYYMSGVIGIYFPVEISLQNRLINIIEKCINDENMRFILFAADDPFIINKNKRLSELSVIQHYKQL